MFGLKPGALLDGAIRIVASLQEAGFTALWAGGCVRDMLMREQPKDFDIATSACPDEVLRLFPKSVAVGKAFGVVRVMLGRRSYEVATFRTDLGYTDGRRPDSVVFSTPEEDAHRRDFTINAIFFDPISETIYDYVGGRRDIEKRLARAVGDPDERFREDHLRMIRAIRFQSVLGFTIAPSTWEAILRNAPLVRKVSMERIQQELTRILLESQRAGDAIDMLDRAGLLKEILPEVAAMKGQEQPPEFHPEGDVFTHTVMMLNGMKKRSLRLAYAILLHDVAKPRTAKLVNDRIRFNNHARIGAEMAGSIMKRLRMPADDVKAVAYCVGNHMRFMDVKRMRRSTLARLVGASTFPTELELHRLDCAASHGNQENWQFLRKFVKEQRSAPILPDPLLNGNDIMKMGAPGGPLVGKWKKKAYDAQLEGEFSDRSGALSWLEANWKEDRGSCDDLE